MAPGQIGRHVGRLDADRIITQHAKNGVASGTIHKINPDDLGTNGAVYAGQSRTISLFDSSGAKMWLLFTSGTIEGFQNIYFIFVLAGGQTTLSSVVQSSSASLSKDNNGNITITNNMSSNTLMFYLIRMN